VVVADAAALHRPAGAAVAGRPRLILKRVAAVSGEPVPAGWAPPAAGRRVPRGRLVLLGDNPSASLDSRQYGFFDRRSVRGVVVCKLVRGGGRAGGVASR
jgi:signal peptidase I